MFEQKNKNIYVCFLKCVKSTLTLIHFYFTKQKHYLPHEKIFNKMDIFVGYHAGFQFRNKCAAHYFRKSN